MSLPISTVAVDSGLAWEQNLNAALTIVDGHNHSPGSGVQINSSGLNINSDLPIGSNNLTIVRSVRFSPQLSPLAGASDVGCLYVSGNDLYYNNVAGGQVQITTGVSVNATSSGISSGSATAAFVSSVLVVNAASNTPANIRAGSILLGNNVSGSNYLTLAPPNAMGASYGLVLPSIPSATSFMQIDTSGNMTAGVPVALGIATGNIANGNITKAKMAAFTAPSTATSTYSTSSASFTTVATVTITTFGRPVMISLAPGSGASIFYDSPSGAVAFYNGTLSLTGGSTTFNQNLTYTFASAAQVPPSFTCQAGVMFIDQPAAGTYTYTLSARITTVGSSVFHIANYNLVAIEL